MIHRINVFLLSLIIAFAPAYVMAVELPPNNSWSWKHHNKQREQKRLLAHLTKNVNELGSKKTVEAVVETKPTASKVGGAMFKRVMATGGGQMIGVMAVVELIEAIGWVMEDGVYVKKIPDDPTKPDPTYEYCYSISGSCSADSFSKNTAWNTGQQACSGMFQDLEKSYGNNIENKGCKLESNAAIQTVFYKPGGMNIERKAYKIKNPAYDPTKEPEPKTVPLTPPLLGAAMLGTGYKDPDPNFNNDQVNTDNWTGVPQAYTPDPSGVGNELADALEDKADRAPKTPDGKSAPIGDPKYQNPLDDNDDANDRQWDGEEGTEGNTENTEKTDPETGEKTNTGTFNLPKFCDWAMTVCEWYEGWKKTDVKVNQHIDDTKQHQTEEKSFWQSVKDWFNWTKEDDLPEKDETDLKVETPLELQNYSVSWNAQCPESQTVNVGFHGIEKEITIINWAFVCSMDYIIKPAVIAFASLSGLYIILGTHRRESD